MTKILSSANPNGYSTMLKVLTDGENNYASEAALQVFGMLGISVDSGRERYYKWHFNSITTSMIQIL